MIIQITLQELMLLFVSAFAIVAGIIMIPILLDIKKVVGILRPLVETNQESIKKTMKTVPGIIDNFGQISNNVKETTHMLKVSSPVILKEVETAANSAKDSIELAGAIIENMSPKGNETSVTYKKDNSGFMFYLNIFEEIFQIIYRTCSSSK